MRTNVDDIDSYAHFHCFNNFALKHCKCLALAYTLLACGMPTYTKRFQAATRTQQLSYPG
jgi:hypothetical protein